MRYGGLGGMRAAAGQAMQGTNMGAGFARGGLPGAALGFVGDAANAAGAAVSGTGSRIADLSRRFSQGRGGNG